MRSRPLLLAAGAYVSALALIGLWSTPVDRDVAVVDLAPVAWMIEHLGLEPQQGYAVIEFTANIALFVPLGVLMLLWWRQRSWWHATAVAFATSLTIEVLQQLVRPERYASAQDVVANTLGGTIGGLLIVAGRRLSRRRRRRAAR
jgi:glycopeptide antibiotics resistance protein